MKTLNHSLLKLYGADVPKLLEWMQDLHWGVGQGIGAYLAHRVNEIKDQLLPILNDNDEIWKGNIIRCLLAKSPVRPDQELITIIRRIADHPTNSEIEDGVDEDAKNLILSLQ